MELIERNIYIEKIKPFIDKQLVKVLIGQRRVGKSFLLKLIQAHIIKQNPDANCLFIDKELHKFKSLKNDTDLIEFIETIPLKNKNYLFIDEIQEIKNFEIAIRSILNEGSWDIYCTGSNADILSSEISTMLSGRQIVVKIYSLSYIEFLLFYKREHSFENLDKYMKFGGLPYLINLPDSEFVISDYLSNIYTTILYRDIVKRYNIRDSAFLENLVKFLADNIGNFFSAKNINEYLKSQKTTKSISVILEYIRYLEKSFFINKVQRIDIHGKKIFEIGEKIYFQDLGLRNILSGDIIGEKNRILENTVINHLLINNWKVYIGKNNNKEIDFVAIKNNETTYFQVALLLDNEKTIEREFGNLLEVKDNYPKYVITMDTLNYRNTYKGIIHLSISDFLLNFK
jgi:predicted AAA+ superfamily ATPase